MVLINGLTGDQYSELSQKLVALKSEIEESLSDYKEKAKPLDLREPIGRLSRMDAMQDQHMAKSIKDGLHLKLRLVNASLSEVETKKYGMCRKCSQSIGFKRLSAKPESPFCVPCQEEIEKRNSKR